MNPQNSIQLLYIQLPHTLLSPSHISQKPLAPPPIRILSPISSQPSVCSSSTWHELQSPSLLALCCSPAPSVISSPLTSWGWHLAGILLGLPPLDYVLHSFLLEMGNQFMCVERISDSWGCSHTSRKKGFRRKCKKAKSRTGTKIQRGMWAFQSKGLAAVDQE